MEQVKVLEKIIADGKLSDALDLIEAMPQEERQQWQIQNLTGVICSYCGQFSEAETFFSAALKHRPGGLDVMYNLADACAAQGKRRKAEALLRHCEQQDSKKELAEDIALLREKLAGQKGGRVLMAAYYFPPLSGSGVFRSIKFAKYLPQFGWQPTVISTDRPPNGWNFADASMVAEIPEGMEVIRIPDGISTRRETSLDGDRVQAILNFLRDVLKHSPDADSIFTKLSQSREGIMELLTFPCPALSWAYDAVQYIEKNIDLDQFEAVYTTSGPSSAHLIGFYLKQKCGIPWVADYRDQWTFNPYGVKYNPSNMEQKLLFELESILLHQADCNLTIADSAIQSYVEQFHLPQEKIASITNGYDEEDFVALQISQVRTDKFTINYSGLLYSEQRSIIPVLKALQQLRNEKKIELSNVRFRIVGGAERDNVEVAEQYGLAQIIEQTGYLSHSQALQANLNANLLLLLVGDEAKFKPCYTGKFFEYLRSGRPILALGPRDGVVDKALRKTGHGQAMLSTQIPKIKSMILQEYKKWERGEGVGLLHSPMIEKFERKVLTEQLAQVFSDVVNHVGSLPGTGSEGLCTQTLIHSSINTGYGSREDTKPRPDLEALAEDFLKKNYNYVWLKAMLHKASEMPSTNATLITGSSYGVNGIIEKSWEQAVNCSASSQDLYYDFLCARKAISSGSKGRYSRCIIVDGYYASCHDVSCGIRERSLTISNVYYPIFEDGHHWNEAYQNDLWAGLEKVSDRDKRACEQLAVNIMLRQGTFFSERKHRGGTVFDLGGRDWCDVPAEERLALGKKRAQDHNKLFAHQDGISRNKEILKEYVHFLHLNNIMPVFILAPFTAEYNQHILKEMKQSILALIASVPEEIHFTDFNQFTCFDSRDFVDTDHLSEAGAAKFSKMLVNMFGA